MINTIARQTESLERAWDQDFCRRFRSASLVAVLIGGVVIIEMGRLFWADDRPEWMPVVHLAAITWAISLLLIYELVEMAFAMSKSVARSVARFLQLYALVLLRDAFLKLESFPEPIAVTVADLPKIAIMVSDAAGGLLLFVAAAVFSKLQKHNPITSQPEGGRRFRAIKRVIVAFLLVVLLLLCVVWLASSLGLVNGPPLLDTFFTVLVFVDVLLAFISLAFTTNPAIVFRNFGFAFAAILLRFAVASPEFIRPAMALAGAVTAIAMTVAYNLATVEESGSPEPSIGKER